MGTCLSDAAVVDLVRGALRGDELRRAEEHLAGCEECRVVVSEVARGSLGPGSARPKTATDDVDAIPPKLEGGLVAGKYRVLSVLGAGAMGFVVAARHELLGERVAIKLPRGELRDDPEARARLLREARAAARLRGEHIARVLDVGVLDDGAPFIVMEHLEGKNFAERLQADRRLGVVEAIDVGVQACAALGEAHALGIVHRDLKPANLFETRRFDGTPLVKVLDFGIAKVPRSAGEASTRSGLVMGSPLYMSPEQLKDSRRVDARSDVWGLGATLFELVAGRPPFEGATLADVCARIAEGPPPSLRAARPDVPEALDRVVARCLERDPARRFASAAELAAALRAAAVVRTRPPVAVVVAIVLAALALVALAAALALVAPLGR